ncbi:MAG TPA: hypothetical protein VGR06_08740 [Actinophytocola sp.]|jgi:hypothetical protein|uniref:hypothetical protein n=1 Tax=Actinophytocola sp. TaxID=1872138 RepID=UPI002DFF9578|nr:hypothetical protein [Actinophytocola sp.]
MPGLEDALARLITDPAFKAQLTTDPRSALAGYELSADDLSVLAREVGADNHGQSVVEQRTSKAGFFGLFAQITEDAGVIIRGPGTAAEGEA